MIKVSGLTKQTLRYIENTGNKILKDHFLEDLDPIGETLFINLKKEGYIEIDLHNYISLTAAGKAVINTQVI